MMTIITAIKAEHVAIGPAGYLSILLTMSAAFQTGIMRGIGNEIYEKPPALQAPEVALRRVALVRMRIQCGCSWRSKKGIVKT